MGRIFVMVLAIAGGLLMAGLSPVVAQQTRIEGGGRVANPGERQFDIQLLRPDGGPVVPLFEGWYQNPDGTYNLCFGYFNVNTEEILEFPIGEDNFIEPIEFDGMQPTQFLPVPGASTTQVTFSEPGEYTLRVQAYHSFSDFEFQCCLTNAYVQVSVSR